jgi:predicted nuclease of restriction endonuclease-like (RecB) superfamily
MKKQSELVSTTIQDLLPGVIQIIDFAKSKAALFLNAETTLMYWGVGHFINTNLKENNRTKYGRQILATLSQELTLRYGKGFTYSALIRMCKVSASFDEKNIATLSQQLSWSHLIELSLMEDELKREYYTLICMQNRWGVRELREQTDKMLYERTSLAKLTEDEIRHQLNELKQKNTTHPDLVFKNTYVLDFLNLPQLYSENELENALVGSMEQFILELGNGFAFMERQKRISVDGEDYHLDLLFYHRKLKRLVAIDLKLGKFKPAYKGQMELYLRWLEKYEMQTGEENPIGLLLCSEGNTEHIELLMLNEPDIKVAQYLTELPDKQWFADKLHKAMEMAKAIDHNNNKIE